VNNFERSKGQSQPLTYRIKRGTNEDNESHFILAGLAIRLAEVDYVLTRYTNPLTKPAQSRTRGGVLNLDGGGSIGDSERRKAWPPFTELGRKSRRIVPYSRLMYAVSRYKLIQHRP